MTFQIAARCAETGRFGVAITTRPMGVGSRCPFIEPGVGLTVTMARTDPRLGPLGINLLKLGYPPVVRSLGQTRLSAHAGRLRTAVLMCRHGQKTP